MLTTINPQPTLWDAILRDQCLGLPAGLVAVDRLLDDDEFFEPVVSFLTGCRVARRSHGDIYTDDVPDVPVPLGFDPLCREVADAIAWRRFCRIVTNGRRATVNGTPGAASDLPRP